MKNRIGFVSNSSSSSFIVPYKSFASSTNNKLSKKDINKLVKFGFKETSCTHANLLSCLPDDKKWKPLVGLDKKNIVKNYGIRVSCNQDDIIYFLVKNNIGFIADIHYGHSTCLFHQNNKYIMMFENFGNQVETYHYNYEWNKICRQMFSEKPYRRILVKTFIKQYEKMEKFFDGDEEESSKG